MLKLFVAFVNVLHNYFNGATKLFLNLHLAKFLDTSTESFFPCEKSYI